MIEVSAVSSSDWRAWRELRLAALAEAPYAFGSTLAGWQGEGDREERWRARLEIPGSVNLMALLDGRAVGMVGGVPVESADAIELISMYVSPSARGRGVGDLLIHAIEAWARARGAVELRLAVVEGNERAQALYRRHGFIPTVEIGDLMLDGVRREVVMAKPLGARR